MGKMSKPLLIGIIAVVVIGAICLFTGVGGIRNLLGNAGSLLGGGAPTGNLGQMYTAVQIDQNGCPVDSTTQFYPDETIYVGLEQSQIPRGTELFARLSRDGQPVEDASPITADQDLQSCVWFEFQPSDGSGFVPGNYTAELMVNGNRVDSIAFDVTGSSANTGGFPSTGGSGVQLGTLHATTAVDNNGCAVDDVMDFYSNEPVYIATEESFVPSGTEIFARLVYQGQAVEDAEPIVAHDDLQTCVWFVFQGTSSLGGLEPGSYAAEIYVNGGLADRIDFLVR